MTEQNFEQMRRTMVASQPRTTGVSNPRVVAAMGAVPRKRFVPGDRVPLAYADALVPLGNGRALNPPMTLGRAPRKGSARWWSARPPAMPPRSWPIAHGKA